MQETNKITPQIRKDFKLLASRLPTAKVRYSSSSDKGKTVTYNAPPYTHLKRISNAFRKEGAAGVEKYIRKVTGQ